jgi:hypothetical protein
MPKIRKRPCMLSKFRMQTPVNHELPNIKCSIASSNAISNAYPMRPSLPIHKSITFLLRIASQVIAQSIAKVQWLNII